MKLEENGPQKGTALYTIVFVHALCKKKDFFYLFIFLLFHFHKYDMSYKMLSHLKVHSFVFDIENIVTTINLLKHMEQASGGLDSPRHTSYYGNGISQ